MCIHDLKNRTCVVATLQNKKSTCKWCSHVRRDLAPKGKTVRKLTGATGLRQRPNGMLCNRRPKEHIGVHCDFPSACENTSLRVRPDWRAGSMNATWRKAHTIGGMSRETPPQSLGPAFNSLGRALQATWWTHWGPFSETPTRSLTSPRCLPPNSIDVTEFPCVKSCLGLCRILGGQGGDNICENIRGLRTKGHDYWNMGCSYTRCRNAGRA